MSQLDARVLFYLRHKKQIDEWAALKKRLAPAANAFYLSLRDGFEDLAAEFGEDVSVWHNPEAKYVDLALFRDSWQYGLFDRPAVAVALEWHKTKVSFGSAYHGIFVRKDVERPDIVALDHAVRARIDACDAMEVGDGRTPWWPVYRLERPRDDAWWEDLTRFRMQLLEAIRHRWATLSPVVDEVIRTLPPVPEYAP